MLMLGCVDPDSPEAGANFVAMQSDFAGFWSWTSTEVDPTDSGHGGGAKTVYLDAQPSAGSESFPVGTILLKLTPTDQGEDLHAMAKRGGGYNPSGAVGWEWFDLELAADGLTPVITWRGPEPPSGDEYSSSTGEADTAAIGDCNACHAAAQGNDYVHTVAL